MMRVIVTPAVLPPAALAELKQWLGVTTTLDDEPLGALLRAALEVCADFTGVMPLACTCEEALPAAGGWRALATRPVTGLVSVATLAVDGGRVTLGATAFEWTVAADGGGHLRLLDNGGATRVVVQVTAGLAASWDLLPEVLRHGVIRLAAHQYRNRENPAAAPLPPASVAALWRPWRQMRLA